MATGLSAKHLQCGICQHVYTNPASLPCGHNYCLDCIKNHWDTRTTCECPVCGKVLKPQPDLSINWVLQDITEKFKRSRSWSFGSNPAPPNLNNKSKSEDYSAASHQDATSAATKLSVIGRQFSFSTNFQTPALWDDAEARHTLFTRPLPENHSETLGNFCWTDKKAFSVKSTKKESQNPEIDCRMRESTKFRDQLKKTEKEFEDMIKARKRKAEEIKASVNQCKKEEVDEIQTSAQFMSMIRRAVDTHESLLQVEIKQQQVEVETRSNKLLQEIHKEIDDLQRKHNELQHLKDSVDPLHIIQQRLQSLTARQSTTDWSRVKLQTDNHIGTARNSFATLADICHRFGNQLCAEELTRVDKFAVDVTLDPATTAVWLLLSPDRKQVSLGGQQQRVNLPYDTHRFDSCAAVLGKQSFSSGRHYWIVQVGDKTDWELGVAKESINRSGLITVCPDAGYWAICRRKGESIIACAGPSFTLAVGNPKRVGVFLDYEKGSVTFYNTEAKTHIHTYSGCSFTEPMYPYFNPCHHENGKNTAPLIICRVKPLETTMGWL